RLDGWAHRLSSASLGPGRAVPRTPTAARTRARPILHVLRPSSVGIAVVTGMGIRLCALVDAATGLRLAPELDIRRVAVRTGQAQAEEVERGTEPRVSQHAQHPLALAQPEARLQQPDLLHRYREPAWQRDHVELANGHPVRSPALVIGRRHAGALVLLQGAACIQYHQQGEPYAV